MNRLSAFLVWVSIGLLFGSFQAPCQEAAGEFDSTWEELKTELRRRSDLTAYAFTVFSKSKEIEPAMIDSAQKRRSELFFALDKNPPADSASVKDLCLRNEALTRVLARLLVSLEKDPEFRNSFEMRGLMGQMLYLEERLALKTARHNQECFSANRKDLAFGCGQTGRNSPK